MIDTLAQESRFRQIDAPIEMKYQEPITHLPRVLHFIDSGGFYGAEKVIVCLAQETQKGCRYQPIVGCIVQRKGESVALMEKARLSGIESTAIVIRNGWLPIDLFRASEVIRKMGVDLIHSHGYKPSVFGYFISKLTGMQILATCHLWFAADRPPLKYRVMTWLEGFLYRYFRRVVCVSPQIKEILKARGIRDDQLEIIDNGIDLENYVMSDESYGHRIRQSLSIEKDAFVVLNVGRLTAQKGQTNIIALAEAMRTDGVDAVFVIAGEGEQRGALEALIAEKHLESRVRLLGFRDDIGILLKTADAFFLPSLDEGLPMSLLESMASGVPVVVTPVGAIPQLVENGKNGLLVRIGDIKDMYAALMRIKTDRALAIDLANHALQTVRREYSSERMYRSYERVYDGLHVPSPMLDSRARNSQV